MKTRTQKQIAMCLLGFALALAAQAASISDNFNTSRNYLTNGLPGSIWEGLYTGAGQIPGGVNGAGPGSTLLLNANISNTNRLTISSTQTDWEFNPDDGVLLYKLVFGDFDAAVHIDVHEAAAFNTAGLMARLPGPGGTNENYVSWTRFDQFGIANYFRNEINGGTERRPIFEVNNNYWLRLQRVGNTFFFYERATTNEDWVLRDQQERLDMSGLPVQVGILHAVFDSGTNARTTQFSGFSLAGANVNPAGESPAATGLTLTPAGSGKLTLAWTPGAGNAGSVVVMRSGSPLSAQPTDGVAYNANAAYGSGDALGSSNYVVSVGSGTNVTVSNLSGAVTYYAAVYSYNGSGSNLNYTLATPATGSAAAPATLLSIALTAPSQLQISGLFQATVTANFDAGSPQTVSANSTFLSSDTNVLTVNASGLLTGIKLGSAVITATYQGKPDSKPVQVVNAPTPVLKNRYSFNGNANDSVGGANGTPFGGALITDSELVLDGTTGTYLDLPNNLLTNLTAITWETWVTDNGSAGWARVFDFGNSAGGEDTNTGGTRYMFLALPTAGGLLRAAYNAGSGEQVIEWGLTWGAAGIGRPLPGKKAHVVLTTDNETRRGVIYVNGVQVALNTGVTISPLSVGTSVNNWLGRSQFADPYFNGAIDEFRIYQNAMSPLQVAASAAAGPNRIVTDPGDVQSVSLTVKLAMNRGAFQNAGVFGNFANITNVNLTTVPPITFSSSDATVFTVNATGRIIAAGVGTATLTATYSAKTDSKTITVSAPPATTLTHRYSFSGDANDSVGSAHGNLQGGATFSNGKAVLAGVGYVNLPGGLVTNYDAVTIESWLDVGDLDTGPFYLFSLGESTPNGFPMDYVRLAVRTAGNTQLTYNYGPSRNVTRGAVSYGRQHFVGIIDPTVATGANGAMRLYVNGQLVNSNTVTIPLFALNNAVSYLGQSLNVADNLLYPNASIDEFRIYNGAMSLQEIRTSLAAGPDKVVSDLGPIQSVNLLAQPTMIVGTLRRPTVQASSANVANIDLTGVPTVVLSSGATNVVSVTADGRLRAVTNGTATVTATFGGVSQGRVITVVAAQPYLTHRYSFTTGASDSVGNADGRLLGHASVASGGLALDGTRSTYAELPSNLIDGYTAITVETWVSADSSGNWTRVFDFGNYNTGNPPGGQSYIFLSTHAANADTRAVFNDGAGEQPASLKAPILDGTGMHHLVAVFDPTQQRQALYIDGAAAATNTLSATRPLSGITDNFNFIGRSVFGADSYFAGFIDEVRIYYGGLTSAQIATSFANGPDRDPVVPALPGIMGPPIVTTPPVLAAAMSGGNLVVSWPDSAAGFILESTTALGPAANWTQVTTPPAGSGGRLSVTLQLSETTKFLRLRK